MKTHPSTIDEFNVSARSVAHDVRRMELDDVEACARIAYSAHSNVAALHNVPSEHPSPTFSEQLLKHKLSDAGTHGFVAECDGRIVGSVFLTTWNATPAAAIGPLTVDPAAEGRGAGGRLMQAAVQKAVQLGIERVRLVQSPAHVRSLALYAKRGFTAREPLVLVHGVPTRTETSSSRVRPAQAADVASCLRLCTAAHGFRRDEEIRTAIGQGTASIVERDGDARGYATSIGLRGHAVAESAEDLIALIAGMQHAAGPGFFVPVRNGELVRELLRAGCHAISPAMLMTMGSYQEPRGSFLPSIAF